MRRSGRTVLLTSNEVCKLVRYFYNHELESELELTSYFECISSPYYVAHHSEYYPSFVSKFWSKLGDYWNFLRES